MLVRIICLPACVGLVFVTVLANVAFCAGDDHGHGRGGGGGGSGHHHHGGGSHNFFGISPGGITYGYSDENFGFAIGPIGGGAFSGGGHRHYHDYGGYSGGYVDPYPAYSQPIVNQPSMYYGNSGGYYSQPMVIENQVSPGTIINRSNSQYPTAGAIRNSNSSSAQPTASNGSDNGKSILVRPGHDPNLTATMVTDVEAAEFFNQSVAAFASGDYKNASRHALHAMLEDPQNGKLKLYISQCQLANGDFEAAAAHLYDALAILPTDQWGAVVQNFRQFYKRNDYVPQFDKLVTFTQSNPDAAYGFALRAYHYHFLGHPEAAAKQLGKALLADADDLLTKKLSEVVTAAEEPEAIQLPAPAPDSK